MDSISTIVDHTQIDKRKIITQNGERRKKIKDDGESGS
jgi:hypothetical protein